MSIYTDCMNAISELSESGKIWTELDVIALTEYAEYVEFQEVAREANQAVGNAYRRQEVCRYGPVVLPDGEEDYARIAAKIAYSSAEYGPKIFETPNGSFEKLLWSREDTLTRPGRMPGNNRDDRRPWGDQGFEVPDQALKAVMDDLLKSDFESYEQAKAWRKRVLKTLS